MITKSIENFILRNKNNIYNSDDNSIQQQNILNIEVTNLNAQSLVAHARDIKTDVVLTQCDYLTISETWMTLYT